MGVNLTAKSQKLYNEFKNGIGFPNNLGDFTPNLTGSVMEQLKYVQLIDIEWFTNSALSNPWTVTGTTIVSTTTNFRTEGFAVGDIVDWIEGFTAVPVVFANLTIDSISADGKTITVTVNSGVLGAALYNDAGIRGLTNLTALIYNFGLVDNDESSVNSISKVSDNDQGYYSATVGLGGPRSTAWQTMDKLGVYEDWRSGTMRCRYVMNPTTYVQQFEIEHSFMLLPYYLDGELTNLQNFIVPDLLAGNNSIKYVFEPKFLTAISNPNTEKSVEYTQELGSVAWFNENFNGFNSSYSIISVVYKDQATLEVVDGILIGAKSQVIITVQDANGPMSAGERFGVYVSDLPEQDDYTDKTATDIKENFIYDRALNSEGAAFVGGDTFITSLTATIVSGDLVITMEMEYSADQKTFLSGKFSDGAANYLLGVQVGEFALTSASSDRVILLADAKEYDSTPDIPDLMAFDKFLIFPPDQQISGGVGYDSFYGFIEDGLVIDFDFYLDRNKDAVINTLTFELVSVLDSSNNIMVLDSFDINVGNVTVSAGIQQIEIDTIRGYDLETGDQFNEVQITTGPNVGGLQHYTGRFAQKVSWQDWILNLNIDPLFFDNSLPNNNRNLKANNYNNAAAFGYQIKMICRANVTGTSVENVTGPTDYIFKSAQMIIVGADGGGGPVAPTFSCVIETFTEDGLTNLGGAVQSGDNTLFRATYTQLSGALTDIIDFWAFNRIERTDQPGFDIEEINNLTNSPNNDLLLPSAGTNLDLQLVAGKAVAECLINGANIVPNVGYNLSGRIDDVEIIIPGNKVTSGISQDQKVTSSTSPLNANKVTSP